MPHMFEELKGRTVRSIDEDEYREYAVMVPLILSDDGPLVLFERRAAGLKRQPGEICFPGGAREGEESSLENAVRETSEELRISPEQIEVLAHMDTLYTVYNNRVAVYMSVLHEYRMTYSEAEVGEIFTVPLRFFVNTQPEVYTNTVYEKTPDDFPYSLIPGGKNYHWRRGRKNIYFYIYGDHVIWGMTAYIMRGVIRTLKAEAAGSLKSLGLLD